MGFAPFSIMHKLGKILQQNMTLSEILPLYNVFLIMFHLFEIFLWVKKRNI